MRTPPDLAGAVVEVVTTTPAAVTGTILAAPPAGERYRIWAWEISGARAVPAAFVANAGLLVGTPPGTATNFLARGPIDNLHGLYQAFPGGLVPGQGGGIGSATAAVRVEVFATVAGVTLAVFAYYTVEAT